MENNAMMSKTKSKFFNGVLVLTLTIGSFNVFAAQKVALVIGNSEYNTVSDRLKNPANDAKAVAARLKALGYDTELLLNANLNKMLTALNGLNGKVDSGGTAIVYYAGHGIQLSGQNYLVPVDASMSNRDMVKREAIQLQDVIDKLESTGAANRLVILDACRNDPFPKTFRAGTRGLTREQLTTSNGMMVMYAASPNEVADDGKGQNGTFTQALLNGLNQSGVKLPEMMDDIREQVRRDTKGEQNPYYEGTGLSRFVLVPAAPVVSAPIQVAPDAEITFWNSIANSTDANDYAEYLKAYPNGKFAGLAQSRKEKYTVKPQQLATNTLDVIEKNLRVQLQGSGVAIRRQSKGSLLLISPFNLIFATGEITIKPDFFDTLNNIALVLKNNKILLTVSGHTDNVGRDDLNLKRSQQRATAVAQYLWSQGVKTSIHAIGLGKSEPIADNATEVGRAQNRRIEITVSLQE